MPLLPLHAFMVWTGTSFYLRRFLFGCCACWQSKLESGLDTLRMSDMEDRPIGPGYRNMESQNWSDQVHGSRKAKGLLTK